MTLNRRLFLSLTAAAVSLTALPAQATVSDWQGTGLGAALSLRLIGDDPHHARRTFSRVEAEIARVEATASLHRDSSLTRLNRDGRLAWPDPAFLALLDLAGQVHAATRGAFDPTVQPLWQAIATGGDTVAARAAIGWDRVRLSHEEIRLAPGQALTLNGIAQGWAADRIAALLRAEGYANALIDMGEINALGQREDAAPWRVAIAGPTGQPLAETALTNRALATSSPMGTRIGADRPHIIGPAGQNPLWQTAAVSAASAALADALSTAFCLMSRAAIDDSLARFPDARLEALA
ncbi:MAG: FAD:protein FMN transferase [Paracoccaceae bacterium]